MKKIENPLFINNKRYVDPWGQIWIAKLKNGKKCLFSESLGWGCWDHGNGLQIL